MINKVILRTDYTWEEVVDILERYDKPYKNILRDLYLYTSPKLSELLKKKDKYGRVK